MAQIPIRRFSFRLLIFSIIIAALSVLFQYFFPECATPTLPYIVIFFFFITLFSLYVVLRNDHKKENRAFMSGYMLSRIVKFTSCLLFLFLYIFLRKDDGIRFAISFIVIYFLYSGFEIYILKKETAEVKGGKQENSGQ
ncbi:MAG: hypothetical protein LBV02_00830 [Bacteroidales bacterium]|jgi:L-asparagine transporter-like permease|nr:hypothetical protein [Bacteroidales bacterium]